MRFWLGAILLGATSTAFADCQSTVEANVVLESARCAAVDVEDLVAKHVEATQPKTELEKTLARGPFEAYRGFLVSGTVAKADAKAVKKGATVKVFVPAATGTCELVKKGAFRGHIVAECCDGHLGVPCALGTSYIWKSSKR